MTSLHDASLTFAGPSCTLFALGSRFLSIQSHDIETLLPTSDLFEFLIYLAETPAPSIFTAPEGPTTFVVDGGLLYIHGLEGTEAALPLSDFEAFLQFLTRVLESSTSTEEEELSVLDGGKNLDD